MANNDSVKVGGKEIQAVTDESVENILGWTVVFTIGPSFIVDREWLEEKAEELGIPAHVLPSETTNKRAYTRACKYTAGTNLGAASHPDVGTQINRKDYNTFNLEIIDRREEDDIHSEVLGQFIYDGGDVFTQTVTEVPEYVETFAEFAEYFSNGENGQFETHLRSNIGVDIRKMIREFCKKHSTSVKMRDAGAVYFVPAQYEETLMAMKQLVKEIDRDWKNSGYECAIDTIEVIDSADKREMVERKVQKEIDSIIDSALDSAFDNLDEDTAAEDVMAKVGKDLVRAENLAVEHNALLDVELSVREVLQNWKAEVTGEKKQELIEKAAQEVDL